MIKVLSLKDKNEWRKWLNHIPLNLTDIYLTPDIYEIYQKNNDGMAECFIYTMGNNVVIYPYFKNKIPSELTSSDSEYFDIQGCYGYNGLTASTQSDQLLNGFYEEFDKYCRDNRIIAEFTRFNPLLNNHLLSEKNMQVVYDRKTVCLDLEPGYDYTWICSYSDINRNMIRKAIKIGIEVIESDSYVDFMEFAGIYQETMTNIGADSYFFFGQDYFSDFYKLPAENRKLFLAKTGQITIAGCLFMFYGKNVHYHLSARKKEFGHIPATNFILDRAIKYSIQNSYQNFYLGGGTDGSEKNTLLKFKSNFSKTTLDFYFGKKIHDPVMYRKVVDQWEKKFPGKKEKYENLLLKYRY